MRNVGLDESQVGIKIARRKINNLRYADDMTLMAEELKNLLMRVKEKSKNADLKLNIQKMKIMASSCNTSWQIDGEKVETVIDFIFLGFTIIAGDNCLHAIKTHLLFVRKATTNLIKKQRHHFVDKAPYS